MNSVCYKSLIDQPLSFHIAIKTSWACVQRGDIHETMANDCSHIFNHHVWMYDISKTTPIS